MKKLFFLVAISVFMFSYATAQLGLEDIIVETYYISEAADMTDTNGPDNVGSQLATGSVTYRIYVDMAPDYELQAVYGNENHELLLNTSTYFFNNYDRGEETGEAISENRLDENSVALDSWVTLGAASDSHLGVLKIEDTDGSIVGGVNNDGGSESVIGGMLVNEDVNAGIPLTISDGLISGTLPSLGQSPGLDLSIFGSPAIPGNTLSIGGAGPGTGGDTWFVAEGVVGPTEENKVLIAQLTTDGVLHFQLNIQIGTADGGVEQYVASNPQADEYFFEALTFPSSSVVLGCTDPSSCNFNELATEDDGSCIFPEVNCTICSESGDLELVDSDGDGICDANEIQGCMDEFSCNYNPYATDEDGSCLFPTENCTTCDIDGELVLVDTDGDGICDADEVLGCTDLLALNYDPLATDDDGSCTYEVGIEEWNEEALGMMITLLGNPVDQEVVLAIETDIPQTFTIAILDLTGRVLVSEMRSLNIGKAIVIMPVTDIISGAYIIQITNEIGHFSRMFLRL